MSVNDSQKHVIDCVLSIFETGRIPSTQSYQTCSILADGAGISYGKHQTTDRGGALDKIVELYIQRGGKHAEELKQFVPKLTLNESAKVDPRAVPSWAKYLMGVLKVAGADPVMQECQDEIFDSNYWAPAVGHAVSLGLRARFAALPPSKGGDEKAWIQAYVNARRVWLLSNKNPLVQKTVYRMDSFNELIKAGNWSLNTPMTVRGVKIA
jgi:chitosanase